MAISVRQGTPDDYEAIVRMVLHAFHDNADDRELIDIDRLVHEYERSTVAVDDDTVVGHAGTFTRDLSIPGGVTPAGFVTMVAVAGTHRRKGIARRMVEQQLRDIRAAGEPIALLWASEGKIYQRFGYGLAARRVSFEVDTKEIQLLGPVAAQSRIRVGTPQEMLSDLVSVYEAERPQRPGYASRSKQWWEHVIADPAARRRGGGALRALIHEGPSGVDGYALWRVKASWDGRGPNGAVSVHHAVATNPDAYREMWRFLLDVDLTRTASLWFGSLDEPLFNMVNEPRRLDSHVGDGLWVRIVDVPAALTARRYAAPVDLVIEVTDDLFPENTGRFRLTGLSGGAHCVTTTDPAEVGLNINTLAALYLGGSSAGGLQDAGRIVEHRHGAVAELHAAFTWHRSPAGVEIF